MAALAALFLGLALPPPAYVEPGHVRLEVSSWCWGTRCGAPLGEAPRSLRFARGATVRVRLAFTPTTARVAVGGSRMTLQRSGRDLAWRAVRAGGLTVNVTGPKGFVAYVGRLSLR